MNKLLLFFLCAFAVVYTSCDKEKKKVECVLCEEMYYAECGVKDEAYQDDDYHDEEDDEDDEEYDDDEKDEYSNWDKYIVEPLVQDPNCSYYTSGTVKFVNKYDEDDKEDDEDDDDEKEHYADVVFFVTYHADGWATKKKMVFEKSCKQKGKEAGEVVFCCKYQQECLTDGAVSKKSLHAKKN